MCENPPSAVKDWGTCLVQDFAQVLVEDWGTSAWVGVQPSEVRGLGDLSWTLVFGCKYPKCSRALGDLNCTEHLGIGGDLHGFEQVLAKDWGTYKTSTQCCQGLGDCRVLA